MCYSYFVDDWSNKEDIIVTSGIADWDILFKTGTKSEYVIINIGESDR